MSGGLGRETNKGVEPWLRGTRGEVAPVQRATLHALDLAAEDAERWCGGLTTEEMESMPFGLPSCGFHLRHMARSLDRLMTYAEGDGLSEAQMAAFAGEQSNGAEAVWELQEAIRRTERRLLALRQDEFDQPRLVGRQRIATTLAGLVVHIADHTQRHTGQMVTTAKVVLALRDAEQSG